MTRHSVTQHFPRSRRGHRNRILLALLAVPFVVGAISAPVVAPGPVHGDELSDARAQQQDLARRIKLQKARVASLTSSQNSLEGRIAATRSELAGISQDLTATRKRVNALEADVAEVQGEYNALVADIADLGMQLKRIEVQEGLKKADLLERKAELADRIRVAYEAERTSMLETFLSGATFTDLLAEMSTQLDAADQDRALAQRIARDRETLLALHRTVEETRSQADVLRQQAEVQKQRLDRRVAELRKQQTKLKALEKAAKSSLAAQRASYARMAANKAQLKRTLAATAAARKKLERKIDRLVASQYSHGNIPSQYNGSLAWPMSGSITQDFGCTGFSWEPPSGGCAHWHNGIDMVAAYGTPVRASGAGRVVYVGWNYADGADPAFIVIIAHSAGLSTWYAHLMARYPVHAGQSVRKGQVIGYEGNTGHSTGAHLHWMVQFNGSFVNPRLFT